VKGNLAILISLVISGAINFLAIAVFSRLFSEQEYGMYAMSISAMAFGYSFMFFWLSTSFMRYAAAGPESISRVKVTSLYKVYSLLVLLTALLVLFFSLAINSTNLDITFWSVIFIIVVSEAAFNLLATHVRFITLAPEMYAGISILRSILALCLGWYLVKLGFGFLGALLAVAFSFVSCAVFLAFVCRLNNYFSIKVFDSTFIKEVFHFGLPIVMILAVQTAISAADRFLLGYHLGSGVAGQYSVSQDFVAKSMIVIAGILHRVYFPVAVKLSDEGDLLALKVQLGKHITYILAVLIPAVSALIFYAESIVTVVIGEEFQQVSIQLMPYQALIALLHCVTMFYLVGPFYLKKQTKSLIFPCFVVLLINTIVGFFAIPGFGIWGAVIGSFTAYSFYFFFSFVASRKLLALPLPGKEFFKILVASIGMVIVIAPFNTTSTIPSLLILVSSGCAVYAFFAFVLNILNVRHIALCKFRTGV
jgi:O-antigen/teichoic acid export membrane protein